MAPSDEPPVNYIFVRDGFGGPFPIFGLHCPLQSLTSAGQAAVVVLSDSLVIKHGAHIKVNEAHSLLFVEKHVPNLPAPRLHACYVVGPYDRDADDYGSLYDTYIIMTYIRGKQLDDAWPDLTEMQKSSIASQLERCIRELRAIAPPPGLASGSVTGGPLDDFLFESEVNRGPFVGEQDFNNALSQIHAKGTRNTHERAFVQRSLGLRTHRTVLSHGDLQGRNIMVLDDKVTGIIDWEYCGWYPEYWEFARCFRVPNWEEDWPSFVASIMQSYCYEYALLSLVGEHVW